MLYPRFGSTEEPLLRHLWYPIQIGRRRIGRLQYLAHKAIGQISIDRQTENEQGDPIWTPPHRKSNRRVKYAGVPKSLFPASGRVVLDVVRYHRSVSLLIALDAFPRPVGRPRPNKTPGRKSNAPNYPVKRRSPRIQTLRRYLY